MNKFPWNCGECPMLHTYDLSIDDLTHVCLWSKSQIDDCDKYKSAECPMEKHDDEIRINERAKAIDEYTEVLRPLISELRNAIEKNRYAFIDLDLIAHKLKEQR